MQCGGSGAHSCHASNILFYGSPHSTLCRDDLWCLPDSPLLPGKSYNEHGNVHNFSGPINRLRSLLHIPRVTPPDWCTSVALGCGPISTAMLSAVAFKHIVSVSSNFQIPSILSFHSSFFGRTQIPPSLPRVGQIVDTPLRSPPLFHEI